MSFIPSSKQKTYWHNKHVWIIGASSGIGKALAMHLAHCGALVNISARSADVLQDIAKSHQSISAYPMDVTEINQINKARADIEAKQPLDLVIHSAAMYEPMTILNFNAKQINDAMALNFGSVVNLVDAILPSMQSRKQGHIAIVASVAGYIGLPNALAYGASKAALINFCESLYAELANHHITVSVINPGFVTSQLTNKNNFSMPFIISPEKAAIYIEKGLRKQRFEIHFPKKFTYIMKYLHSLPYQISLKVLKNLAKNTHSSNTSNKEA